MSRELYMAAHEELVDEYLEAHPDATWDEAYEATADGAWDRARDNYADRLDAARQRLKDEGLAAPLPFRSEEDAKRFAQAIINIAERRNAEIARRQP